jgi:hypothetical protein
MGSWSLVQWTTHSHTETTINEKIYSRDEKFVTAFEQKKSAITTPRAVCTGAATVETLLPIRQPAPAKAASSLSLWQQTAGLDSRGPARMQTGRVHAVRDR